MASENTNNVSVEKLTKRMGKYSLVVVASERAKELKRFEERIGEVTPSNQIRNALTDIANAQVKIIVGDAETEESGIIDDSDMEIESEITAQVQADTEIL